MVGPGRHLASLYATADNHIYFCLSMTILSSVMYQRQCFTTNELYFNYGYNWLWIICALLIWEYNWQLYSATLSIVHFYPGTITVTCFELVRSHFSLNTSGMQSPYSNSFWYISTCRSAHRNNSMFFRRHFSLSSALSLLVGYLLFHCEV